MYCRKRFELTGEQLDELVEHARTTPQLTQGCSISKQFVFSSIDLPHLSPGWLPLTHE